MSDRDSANLKTALTMSKPNLDASIEAAEEENRNVLREIVDPTPGLMTDDLFTDADLNRVQNENEAKFKLGNAVQETLDRILNDVTRNISWSKESGSTIPFSQHPTDDREDFVIDTENKNIKVSKSALQTKITTAKKKPSAVNKRSPYFLRKRKAMYLDSAGRLSYQPFVKETIPDQETDKIKAAESIVDSIVRQLPDQHKKLKFDLDETNDIKITEL